VRELQKVFSEYITLFLKRLSKARTYTAVRRSYLTSPRGATACSCSRRYELQHLADLCIPS
jgi:hypothetical protein